MILERQAVEPFLKNGYVVGCEETREAAIIDPGNEVASLLTYAERQQLTIRHILLTHAHVDHITGVAAAKRATGAPVYLHRDDLFLYERAVEFGEMFGLRTEPQPPIDVYFTPGHCPGGVCLQIGKAGTAGRELFVGDTLFAGSIGRSDLPGGDYQVLIASIKKVLFPLGDDAIVHSGHGPDTTIGRERQTNPFLLADSR